MSEITASQGHVHLKREHSYATREQSRLLAITSLHFQREAGNLDFNVIKRPLNTLCKPKKIHLQAGCDRRALCLSKERWQEAVSHKKMNLGFKAKSQLILHSQETWDRLCNNSEPQFLNLPHRVWWGRTRNGCITWRSGHPCYCWRLWLYHYYFYSAVLRYSQGKSSL